MRRRLLKGLSDAEIAALYWHWDFWARPDQLPPQGDWSCWMMLGGRGAGKTRAGAEWVRGRIEAPTHKHPARRIALIGETFAAADVPLGEAREAYRLTILADGKAAHHEDTPRPEWALTSRRREAVRQGHAGAQNWCLRVQQLNDRNEAGAPLDIPLPMNEAEND